MKIELYSDGSATVASKPGGYGFVVVFDGIKVYEGYGHMEKATNNDAELEAAVQGLAYVLKMRIDGHIPIGQHEVWLVSDSEIVLGWANGTYRFKQLHKMQKFNQLRHVVQKLNVKTRWVEGHSGDEYNELCDKLANRGRKMHTIEHDQIEKPKKTRQKKTKDIQSDFRWNEVRQIMAWNSSDQKECQINITDKSLINNPETMKYEDLLRALCRVVSELVEIKETK